MATTNFNNRLITPELTEALSSYPLYSQDAKKKDAISAGTLWKVSRKAMTSRSMVLWQVCKKPSTATNPLLKWQESPMTQVSTDLAH